MPAGFVQLIYRTSHDDGCRFVGHADVGAIGYTGSRSAGLRLKESADKAGNPIYLELSSINPVFILPGALAERSDEIAGEFSGSCLVGTGQFCTNPGMVVLLAGEKTDAFVSAVTEKFAAPAPVMLVEVMFKVCPPPPLLMLSDADCAPDPLGKFPNCSEADTTSSGS